MHRAKAVFVGAFDPIHNGHVQTACAVREYVKSRGMELEFLFLPVKHSLGGKRLSPLEHRLAMVSLATQDYAFIKTCGIDNDAVAPRRNDTRLDLLRSCGVVPDYWVHGSDVYNNEQLRCMGAPEIVGQGVRLAIVERKDYPLPSFRQDVNDEPICIPDPERNVVFLMRNEAYQGVCSFGIRADIAAGRHTQCVHDLVLEYILRTGLYASHSAVPTG